MLVLVCGLGSFSRSVALGLGRGLCAWFGRCWFLPFGWVGRGASLVGPTGCWPFFSRRVFLAGGWCFLLWLAHVLACSGWGCRWCLDLVGGFSPSLYHVRKDLGEPFALLACPCRMILPCCLCLLLVSVSMFSCLLRIGIVVLFMFVLALVFHVFVA